MESNPGSTQNDCKSPVGLLGKIKVFKGTAKKCDLSENNVNVASDPKVQSCFLSAIQPVSLDIIKPWLVTCPCTLEPLQKLEFEVNNVINTKVSPCQGDITKLNVDVIVNSVIGGGGIDGAIHKAAGPGSVSECQKLNACETGECKVTLGHKLPAKYLFHIVRLVDTNEHKLSHVYKSCLQKVLAYNEKSIAFCCGAIGILRFDPREAAKMALASVSL